MSHSLGGNGPAASLAVLTIQLGVFLLQLLLLLPERLLQLIMLVLKALGGGRGRGKGIKAWERGAKVRKEHSNSNMQYAALAGP
jgi:hypothetical protein